MAWMFWTAVVMMVLGAVAFLSALRVEGIEAPQPTAVDRVLAYAGGAFVVIGTILLVWSLLAFWFQALRV